MKSFRLILSIVLSLAAVLTSAQQTIPYEVRQVLGEASNLRERIYLLNETLANARASKNREIEAHALYWLGASYESIQEQKPAAENFLQASEAFRLLGDEPNEVKSLNRLGLALDLQGLHDKAVEIHVQARDISKHAGDKAGEATALNNLGTIYQARSDWTKALEYYGQALLAGSGNAAAEASTLNNMGTVYINLGQADKAEALLLRANVFWEAAGGSDSGENTGLIALGTTYMPLSGGGESPGVVKRGVGKGLGYAKTLENLGGLYAQRGRLDEARKLFDEALDVVRDNGFRPGIALVLSNMATIESKVGNFATAVQLEVQAIDLWNETGYKAGEAASLIGLASFQNQLGMRNEAGEKLRRSLALWKSIGDRSGEAIALAQLRTFYAKESPDLAIYFGKEAVNLYQSLRGQISVLPQDTRESYRESVSSQYRNLADLLVERGRIPEAERVLRLLKDQEVFQYVRGTETKFGGTVALTAQESAWNQESEIKGENIAALSARSIELSQRATLSAAEEQELRSIQEKLTVAEKDYQAFLDAVMAQSKVSGRTSEINNAESIQRVLSKLPVGTVAVYTLSTPESLKLIFLSSTAAVGHTITVSSADLSKKVEAFRQAMIGRQSDVQQKGKDLYDLLLKPIEQDLQGAGARTIMWSLDDRLRYIPVGALFDGSHYLIERYDSVVFNPSFTDALADSVELPKSILAAGVSESRKVTAPGGQEFETSALPGVKTELGELSKVFPGATLLPGPKFTLDALTSALLKRPQIVHFATHFAFVPGDETKSFLLTGSGPVLGLEEVRSLTGNLLNRVALLTLSACETGLGGTLGDGSEVEGVSVVLQKKGAAALISTLWAVSDESTAFLMGNFYKEWATRPELGKAEALRRAQIAMLSGEIKEPSSNAEHRGIEQVSKNTSFRPDPNRPFAHPYYWAPFVLSGNWK